MTQEKLNINSRKGKHLSYQERCQIAILKKDGYSNRHIAKVLGCVPQTINNEINKGTITQVKKQNQKGKIYQYTYTIYNADVGQAKYEQNRLNSGRHPKWSDSNAFIEWADVKLLHEQWSPDAVVCFAKRHQLFDKAIIPCTTTLYHWIDSGVMQTRNLDLLEKLKRNTKKRTDKTRRNKRILGQSIENRPKEIDSRGLWSSDPIVILIHLYYTTFL